MIKISRKSLLCIGMIGIVTIVIAITVSFAVKRSSNKEANNKVETVTIRNEICPFLSFDNGKSYRSAIMDIIVSKEKETTASEISNESCNFIDPRSSEWKAIQWLIIHDPMACTFAARLNESATLNLDAGSNMQLNRKIIQRFVLSVIYYSSGGIWKNFPTDAGWIHNLRRLTKSEAKHQQSIVPETSIDECSWLGVQCSLEIDEGNNSSSIIGLNFSISSVFFLDGMTIPSSIGLLTDLQILDISNQGLRGSLPSFFFQQLSNLRRLDLSNNQLTHIFQNSNLVLSKTESNLQGEEQAEAHLGIANLIHLQHLSVKSNKLNEPLPALSALTSLRKIDLGNNLELTGNFWENVPHWREIESIEIYDTALSGSIPEIFDSDSYRFLTTLDASNTALSGKLPLSLARATGLKTFSLAFPTSAAGMSGTFPTEYGMFSDLSVFLFNYMKNISGTLPTEYGNLKSMVDMNIESNSLSGTIPTEWGRMTNLNTLIMTSVSISGSIPSELGHCSLLKEFVVTSTQLIGTMPSEICSLTRIGQIDKLEADCKSPPGTEITPRVTCDCCSVCGYIPDSNF